MSVLTTFLERCSPMALLAEFSAGEFGVQLDGIVESLSYFGPEAQVGVAALLIFTIDLFIPVQASRHLAWLAVLGCFVPAVSIATLDPGETHNLFLGMIALDSFANFFKQFFLLGTIPVILISYTSLQLDGRRMGEFYGILLASVLGAMLMASSTHFLMLFMSLELLSICSYVLVGYVRRDRRSAEAALKYIIYGSIAAGIMGFGLSLYFGLTGSAQIGAIADIQWDAEHELWSDWTLSTRAALTALTGLVMIFMGLAYKMSTIPMHFWAPDVYEGAPTPVTAFLSVISKAAGFALALRILSQIPVGPGTAEVWQKIPWLELMVVISAVTMTFGNLAALWQTNLKRLLAYSSIAHAGYMMMGLAILRGPGGAELEVSGQEAITFYLLAYLAMNFGAFAVITLIENRTRRTDLESYRGLGTRAPYLAAAMVVFLFSLIGLPPTAGFTAKFQLFKGVIDAAQDAGTTGYYSNWYWFLLLTAGANTAVSAYYYLRVAKEMYLVDVPVPGRPILTSALGKIIVAAMVVLTFYFFFGAEVFQEITSKLAFRTNSP